MTWNVAVYDEKFYGTFTLMVFDPFYIENDTFWVTLSVCPAVNALHGKQLEI